MLRRARTESFYDPFHDRPPPHKTAFYIFIISSFLLRHLKGFFSSFIIFLDFFFLCFFSIFLSVLTFVGNNIYDFFVQKKEKRYNDCT